jgi:hypothetical protein
MGAAMTTASILGTALAFAKHGYAVLPVHWPINIGGRLRCSCRRVLDCTAPAKHPLERLVRHGVLSASTDETTVRKWFADESAANLGVSTDKLIVVDADPRHGGDDTLAELERKHTFPPTWRVLTGGGGEHVIFACPAGVEVVSYAAANIQEPPLGPGIDVRARGGYIVAPPSVHISGRVYSWSVDHHPAHTPLAEAPDWLVERLVMPGHARHTEAMHLPQPYQNWLKLTREPVTEYADLACARFAGYLVCHIDPAVALDLLFWWNERICQPPLEAAEVHRIWRRIVRRHAERIKARESQDA